MDTHKPTLLARLMAVKEFLQATRDLESEQLFVTDEDLDAIDEHIDTIADATELLTPHD